MISVTPSQSLWKKSHSKISTIGSGWEHECTPHRARLFHSTWSLHTGVSASVHESATTSMDRNSLSFQTYRIYIQRNETVKRAQTLLLTTLLSTREHWESIAYQSDHHPGFAQHRPHRICSFSSTLIFENASVACLKDLRGQGSAVYLFFISHLLTLLS